MPRAPLRVAALGDDAIVLSFELVGPTPEVAFDGLTAAQREVVSLALSGLSDGEIAARRRCSRHTVASQLQSAYRRLGIGSRAELVALTVELPRPPPARSRV